MRKEVMGVYGPGSQHWVGDGFRVHGYFSAIPDADRKLSPFLMLDYHPPHHYPPTEHRRGVGVCGVFTYEVAETKVNQVTEFARRNQHPLRCTLEKE